MLTKEEMKASDDVAIKKKEIFKTPLEFALELTAKGSFDLSDHYALVLREMDPSDFLDATMARTPAERLKIFLNMMERLGLKLHLEGSIHFADFHISERSWRIETTNSSYLSIKAIPVMLKRSIDDLVSFLQLLPHGQGFALKPCQDLFLEGLTSQSLMDYYNFCQQNEDPIQRDHHQNLLFETNFQMLSIQGLSLKIFAIHAVQLERMIDVNGQGIVFKAVAIDKKIKPSIIVALMKK